MIKNYFKFATVVLAALAMFPACKDGNDDKKGGDDPQDEEYKEIMLQCSVDVMENVGTQSYGAGTVTMPGDSILEFFDMTAEEFYHAMGTYTGTAPSTTQVDNTIQFGVCTGNDFNSMNFCPSTSNNFGCWMTSESAVTTWADETALAVFYHESNIEWGLEEVDEETLGAMWDFTVGFYPGHNEYKAGDKIKATYFFYKEADDVDPDMYCYVTITMNVIEQEEVQLDVIGEETQNFESYYESDYTGHPLNLDNVCSQLGLETAGDAYGVYADGSYSAVAGRNFWFTPDGSAGNWGDEAGICINDDAGTGAWNWCMMADVPSLEGQTLYGAVAFVNDNNQAYIVRVVEQVLSYQDPEEKPGTNPESTTQDVAVTAAVDAEYWAGSVEGFAEVVKNAFNMTTYEVNKAITNGEIVTSGSVWVNAASEVCDYGDDAMAYTEVYSTFTELTLDYGVFPGHVQEGETYNITYTLTYGECVVTYNLTITVGPAAGEGE